MLFHVRADLRYQCKENDPQIHHVNDALYIRFLFPSRISHSNDYVKAITHETKTLDRSNFYSYIMTVYSLPLENRYIIYS